VIIFLQLLPLLRNRLHQQRDRYGQGQQRHDSPNQEGQGSLRYELILPRGALGLLIQKPCYYGADDTGTRLRRLVQGEVLALGGGGGIARDETGQRSVCDGVPDYVQKEQGEVRQFLPYQGYPYHAKRQQDIAQNQRCVLTDGVDQRFYQEYLEDANECATCCKSV